MLKGKESKLYDPSAKYLEKMKNAPTWEEEYYKDNPKELKRVLKAKKACQKAHAKMLKETDLDIEWREAELEKERRYMFSQELDKMLKELGLDTRAIVDFLKEEEKGPEIECDIIDNVKEAVKELPETNISKAVCSLYESRKKNCRSLKKAPDRAINSKKSAEELFDDRINKIPEARERSKQEFSNMVKRCDELSQKYRPAFLKLIKRITQNIELVRVAEDETALRIKGKENINNLKLSDAKPGDIFGFELISTNGNNLTFKLVRINK